MIQRAGRIIMIQGGVAGHDRQGRYYQSQQFGQLRDINRNPSRLVFGESARLRLGPDPCKALWPAASPPHKQAGHMTAPDQCCSSVRKFLPRRMGYRFVQFRQMRAGPRRISLECESRWVQRCRIRLMTDHGTPRRPLSPQERTQSRHRAMSATCQ